MFKALPIGAAAVCIGYTVIMLIASIPGGDCGGGYMLFAAVAFPWLRMGDFKGLILYLFFFANVLSLILIAASVGAAIDLVRHRAAVRQKLREYVRTPFLTWLLNDLHFPGRFQGR